MKTITVRWHSDAGHGWLEVPIKELKGLGVLGSISHFSYVKGRSAYLEEDQDATIFIRAAKSRGIQLEELPPSVCDYPSPIRSYRGFRA